MDMDAFLKRVDAQMKELQRKASQPREPYTGPERRGIRRALAALVDAEGCGGDCQQGRLPCTCRAK